MHSVPALLLAAALLISMAACSDEDVEEPDSTELLYFEPIGYGQSGTLSDTTESVFRSEVEWRSYRDSLRPIAPFEPVDFSQSIVLLAALPQTTSGHSIDFVTVEIRDSVAVAEYVVGVPSDDCLTASAQTVPFQAIMVRQTDKPVRFTRDTEEYRCTLGRRR